MSLTQDTPRVVSAGQTENGLPVKGSTKIYAGAAVGLSAGYARPLVAGDDFQGFAHAQSDNSNGSDGGKTVTLDRIGEFVLNVTGVTAVTDVGALVYASDDGTFTKTETGNSYIGKIIRWETGTRCVVEVHAPNTNIADVAALAAHTAVAATGAGVDGTGSNAASKADVDTRLATVDANFTAIDTKVNAIITALNLAL